MSTRFGVILQDEELMRLFLLLLIGLMVSGQAVANPAQRFSDLLEQTESVRGLGEQEPVVEACGEQTKKEFVQLLAAGDASLRFEPWYLWYNEMADIDPDDYPTAQSYLDALTAPLAVDGRDPGFSYLTTQAEDDARGSTEPMWAMGSDSLSTTWADSSLSTCSRILPRVCEF